MHLHGRTKPDADQHCSWYVQAKNSDYKVKVSPVFDEVFGKDYFLNVTSSGSLQVAGCLCLDEVPPRRSSIGSICRHSFNMAGPKSSSKSSSASSETSVAVSALWKSYIDQTPDRLKFIDAFLAFIVLSGVLQFVYCVLVTNYPFNAFLAG